MFAVAIIHKDLPAEKQLYTSTKEIETRGINIRPPIFSSASGGNLVWHEDDGDCVDNYIVFSRYVRNFCIGFARIYLYKV